MLRKNVIANFFGSTWPTLLGFFLVPVYLKYLGVEAYGLVGFFVSLQALLAFLDLGLSTTTNREVAIGLNTPGHKEKTRDFVRTLEIIYGLIAVLIALSFFVGADWLARDWINAQELSIDTVRLAAIVFGVTLALRWPVALYRGILMGSERQVLYNILYVFTSTFRSIGAALVVVFVSQTIISYLIWQLFSALVEFVVMALSAWRTLRVEIPHFPKPRFFYVQKVWKFSAAVGANSLLAAIIKQLDRILISKLLVLQMVGYYSTANVAYSAISIFTSPIGTAAFPRLTTLIAAKDEETLAKTYHKLAQIVSFVSVPLSTVLLFFSYDLLFLWTQSEDIASHASIVLSTLALAALFNSMMQIPFALQLAAGIAWIGLWTNIINFVLMAPLMYFLISHFGIAGAGIAWAIFNVFYYLIVPHIMHRHLLSDEKWMWYFWDTGLFIILGMLVFGGVYYLTLDVENFLNRFISIAFGSIFYSAVCLIFYPLLRTSIQDILMDNPVTNRFRQVNWKK